MKRLILVLLGIMLVLTVAVAAEITPVQFPIDDETGTFDVSYTGTPGALYALVVLEGSHSSDEIPEITEDNIQFIDQKTADSSGKVTFDDILLKDATKKSSVYLGGTDLDEAVYLGSVAAISIEVKVGDIIYLQDGTRVVSNDVVYDLENEPGYVVVNSVENGVQTSQKVYYVNNSTVTAVENYKDGAINTSEAAIKADDQKTGIRTQAKFSVNLKNNVVQTGFVATIESSTFKSRMNKAGLNPDNYELTLKLASDEIGAAIFGVAYDREDNIDRYATLDDFGNKIVYCLVTKEGGVPITAKTVLYNIAVRPYYVLEDGTVIYGETTKNTIYDVANNIKRSDPDTYQNNKEYIDKVLGIIAGDVIISGEDLFKPVG